MSPAAAITGSAADAVAAGTSSAATNADSINSRATARWAGAKRAKLYILYGPFPLRTASSLRAASKFNRGVAAKAMAELDSRAEGKPVFEIAPCSFRHLRLDSARLRTGSRMVQFWIRGMAGDGPKQRLIVLALPSGGRLHDEFA